MKDQAIQILEAQGALPAIQFLQSQADTPVACAAFNDLLKHAYNQMKDIHAVVEIAQAGIKYAGDKAAESTDKDLSLELLGRVKALNYNLASFTWPGWDEEGIGPITPEQLALGLQAARENLRLAVELKRDDLRRSRAYWVVAAQLLAAGDLAGAGENFEEAVKYAAKAGEAADEALSRGYLAVTAVLANPEDQAAQQALAAAKETLSQMEYVDFFINQLDSTLRVFGG